MSTQNKQQSSTTLKSDRGALLDAKLVETNKLIQEGRNVKDGIYNSNPLTLPSSIKKRPFAVDTAIVVDNGLLRNLGANPVGFNSMKTSYQSLIEEAESLTSTGFAKKTEIIRYNDFTPEMDFAKSVVVQNNLTSVNPWGKTGRLAVVPLDEYRKAIAAADWSKNRKHYKALVTQAFTQVIPYEIVNATPVPFEPASPPEGGGGSEGPVVTKLDVPHLFINVPGVWTDNINLFEGILKTIFGNGVIPDAREMVYENRFIHGTLEVSDANETVSGRPNVMFSGGNDHDSGVLPVVNVRYLITDGKAEPKAKCLITIVSFPVVATNLGYSMLLSYPADNDETVHTLQTTDYRMGLKRCGFTLPTVRFFTSPPTIQPGDESGESYIHITNKRKYIGDISNTISAMQIEYLMFSKFDIGNNIINELKGGPGSNGAIVKHLFGGGNNGRIDMANIYRAYEFSLDNEMPFLATQYDKKHAGVCTCKDDTPDIVVTNPTDSVPKGTSGTTAALSRGSEIGLLNRDITLSDYAKCKEKYLTVAMRNAVYRHINTFIDGYSSGFSLVKMAILANYPDFDSKYYSIARAEFLRIASRNFTELYTKGYLTRSGIATQLIYDRYDDNGRIFPIPTFFYGLPESLLNKVKGFDALTNHLIASPTNAVDEKIYELCTYVVPT